MRTAHPVGGRAQAGEIRTRWQGKSVVRSCAFFVISSAHAFEGRQQLSSMACACTCQQALRLCAASPPNLTCRPQCFSCSCRLSWRYAHAVRTSWREVLSLWASVPGHLQLACTHPTLLLGPPLPAMAASERAVHLAPRWCWHIPPLHANDPRPFPLPLLAHPCPFHPSNPLLRPQSQPHPALAMRALDEIKVKQREEYTRLTTLSAINDSLQVLVTGAGWRLQRLAGAAACYSLCALLVCGVLCVTSAF
jgi:hypothetical protein